MCGVCGCSEGEVRVETARQHVHHHHPLRDDPAERARLVTVEQDILAKNDALAAKNRQHFASHRVLALNLVSSPGAGKTTLLTGTYLAPCFKNRRNKAVVLAIAQI